ncbi:MAG TPA: metalloregulator ArsR/SmtB family transcription factor [Nitrolancea sp.]
MSSITEVPLVQDVARQLKILADPTRLQIFNLLMEGTRCNCELGDALGFAPNLISHHLSVLRHAGVVDAERDPVDARWVYYSINRETLDQLRSVLSLFFDPARIQPRQPVCGPLTSR